MSENYVHLVTDTFLLFRFLPVYFFLQEAQL